MVFTSEQDAFILMAHFRSGTFNNGLWTYSLQSCIEQFGAEFPNANISYDTFVHRRYVIITRFQTKHCICKGKSTGRPTVLTEKVIIDVQQRMDVNPTMSLSKLSAQTGLSVGTCHKALKKLNLQNTSNGVIQKFDDNAFKEIVKIETDESNDIEAVCIKTETDLLVDIKQEADIVSIDIATLPCEELHNYTSLHSYVDKDEVNVANDQQNQELVFGLDAPYVESETKCFKSAR
ncbi:hypothetical protein NQ314_004463 [Rhamnusium bicolor]|uniref:Transposase n=1 Tax=Rhamnusium bicolor TaxID=1586634 RepID=A0AAV8ZJ53_9CUCU|nr:hypothetical protein NQ314_004463 [Rhamnusium bicolor]